MERSWGDDSGFSLVEVLVSVVIIGICFAGLLGGMATSSLTSGIHRDQADGHILLVSAAEAVKDQVRNPFDCNAASYDALEDVTLPDDPAVPASQDWSSAHLVVVDVQPGYWAGSGFTLAPTCTAGTDLQRITLRVTSPDGRAREVLSVMKRRP